MQRTFADPNAIITAAELEPRLGQPDLRIYDCTIHLDYEVGTGRPYSVRSGRADFETGHIPGSSYLDIQTDLSIDESPYRFTLPEPADLAQRFARSGVSDGARVVLYTRDKMQQATRVWWLLRYLGFDNAAVLDGGWTKWRNDGRPIETGAGRRYPAADLTARPRPGLFVDRAEMLVAIGDDGTCTLNALGAELHSGADARYGRPGRIPGSANVPAAQLLDPETQELLPLDQAAAIMQSVGASPDKRILNYCGGGIAATLDAFVQHQLGYQDIAVYDNSMSEWATDETLPIETD